MNDTGTTASTAVVPSHPRIRRLRRLLLATCVLLLLGGGYVIYTYWAAEDRLQRVMAELDRTDPGWRLEELETRRKVIPPEQNSARVIEAIGELKWLQWPAGGQQQFDDACRELSPEVQIPKKEVAILRQAAKGAEAALAEARKLADLPYGRFSPAYRAGGMPVSWSYAQSARLLAELLKYDARLQSEDGHTDTALAAGRAILNAGRAFHDELFGPSQSVRIAIRSVAVRALERTMAQGQPSDASLASVQRLMEAEESEALLLLMARGDRAVSEQMVRALRSGDRQGAQLVGRGRRRLTGITLGSLNVDDLLWRVYVSLAWTDEAALLEYKTRVVEIARLPIEQQLPLIQQLERTLNTRPLPVRALASDVSKMTEIVLRTQAELGCAIAAMAMERHRLANGHGPKTLGALVPEFLRVVPADPYDGAPLRFRKLSDRVVIYSIGPDGQDNGGNVNPRTNPNTPGIDVGFRLWNIDRRRQPAPNPPRSPAPAESKNQ